ncbi:MAG: hypothetical protein ACR2MF_00655 [Chthoniobacterales bacterium]
MSANDSIASWKPPVKFLAELAVVSVGVFLGLLADQWRENHEHRLAAATSLKYFQREILQNQEAIEQHRGYHQKLAADIRAFTSSPEPKTPQLFQSSTHFRGVEPVFFEHTGWDLALATQSLAYLDSDLAYAISRVYTRQQAFQNLEGTALQAIYNRASLGDNDAGPMAQILETYLTDANIQEAAMLDLYRDLLPRLSDSPSLRPQRH